MTTNTTPDTSLCAYDSIRLVEMISRSQDGNPIKQIREEMKDGRLMHVTDNLNRLIADVLNNAIAAGDLNTLAADLDYAAKQLRDAHARLIENTYCPTKRKVNAPFGVTYEGERTMLP